MKTLIPFFIAIVILGCNSAKQNHNHECIEKDFKAEFIAKDSLGVPYYQSDDFASVAVRKYTIKSVKQKYANQLKLTLIPITNIHDATIVDTLYNYSNTHNRIEFYRAKHADFIQKFDVSDATFKLEGCISVGILKERIAAQFGIKERIGDTITIGDTERISTFTFYFKNNKLARIDSYQYID